MTKRNPSEELNAHTAGRLHASQAAWQTLAPDARRQKEAAEALLQRMRENPDPAVAPLVQQLEHLVAQLQAASMRIDHHLPLAERSAQRVEALQAVVNRQNLLRDYEDLLDVHPEIMSAEPMLKLLEEVWRRVVLGGDSSDAGPFTAWEAAMLGHLDRSLLAPRRTTALLLAGCANPFFATSLWRKARVAVCEPDKVICHWIQGLVSRHLLLGEGGAVSIEARAVDFMDAIRLDARAFDLIWFGLEFWDSWAKAPASELLTALGQLNGRVEFLGLSVMPDLRDEGRKVLEDSGYALEEEWRTEDPAAPVTLLVRNAASSAGGAFYLETQTAIFDPMIEALIADPKRRAPAPAVPPPKANLSVAASPSVRDPETLALRTRMACALDRVIVSFHSPTRDYQDELRAAAQLADCLRGLDGSCPQVPAVLNAPHSPPNPVILQCGGPVILLSSLPPRTLDWERLWDEVLQLTAALCERGLFLNGLRPGWFVQTPAGLRLCGSEALSSEETEDAISAIWWFFHDLASAGPRWRAWPAPPPVGDLPGEIPAALREKLAALLECDTLADALQTFRTP